MTYTYICICIRQTTKTLMPVAAAELQRLDSRYTRCVYTGLHSFPQRPVCSTHCSSSDKNDACPGHTRIDRWRYKAGASATALVLQECILFAVDGASPWMRTVTQDFKASIRAIHVAMMGVLVLHVLLGPLGVFGVEQATAIIAYTVNRWYT